MSLYYPKCVAQLDAILYDYGDASQKKEFHFFITPLSTSVNINSYNLADTFSMTVRFEDLPFDPRLLRALRVSIAITDLKRLRNLSHEELRADPEKVIFIGFADTHSIRFDHSERVITFDGRDYTSFFIDQNYPNKEIDLKRPVKSVIEDLIKQIPGAEKIRVDDQSGQAIKSVAKSLPSFNLLTGKPTTDGQFHYVSQNRTYWDVIVSLAESAALIAYMDRDKLVLSTPRILYSAGSKKKTLQFVYGLNLMELGFSRNLGRKKKFNLALRSFDVRTGAENTVYIPRDAEKAWTAALGINKANAMVKSVNTTGVAIEKAAPFFSFAFANKTKEELIQLGQKIYEEFIRQQLEGEMVTREMRVNDSQGAEFDLTKIRVGTPVFIDALQEDIQYILRAGADGAKITDGQRSSYLSRKGYNETAADALIKAISRGTGKLRPLFYTREAQIDMGQDGFELRIGFVNYIQVSDIVDGKLGSG